MQLGRTKRSRAVRTFLIDAVRSGKKNIIADACDHFSISRQSVHRHVAYLTEHGFLVAEGTTRARTYRLGPKRQQDGTYALSSIQEDSLYSNDFAFVFEGLPRNIEDICHYGLTEMVNNAIDHSGGTEVEVSAQRMSDQLLLTVRDDGEGIFIRIARLLELGDPREAILELSKGKLTTDPDNHTGEGIFFTSRVFDLFLIRSADLMFHHLHDSSIDMLNHSDAGLDGTFVLMTVSLTSSRTLESVFDEYTDRETFDFTKTVVPVRLALHEGDQLISRSQAKRIMNRVERFRNVMLDFEGVEMVGRSFSDEIFRVFAKRHPEITIKPVNMNQEIEKAITRIRSQDSTAAT
jgi:anti-sigma regulatory factor (Ser/Thr protein kinase)